MPAKADDFTITLLHRIQGARLSPEGGWLTLQELRSLMGLSQQEAHHLTAPLAELMEAGMIEKHFQNGRDEWRSRGVQPAMGRTRQEAARDLMQEAIEEVDRRVPAIFTVVLGGRAGRARHAAFLASEYPEVSWYTQCGRDIPAEKMTAIESLLVTCPDCNDNLLRSQNVRAMLTAKKRQALRG